MNLEKVMTKEEKEAVSRLIQAHLGEQFAQVQLQKAKEDLRQAAVGLRELWCAMDENDQPTTAIPDAFAAYYGATPYLIEIDDNSEWRISLIGGVLGSSPNEK